MAQKGLLKIICGTDTLGVGINVPIRTVLFTKLCKYDGQKTGILSARDFHQIAGRAGRKGFDDVGWVVAQAPEHAIENLKLAAKAAAGGKKFVKRQPPDKNYVNWNKQTFERLMAAQPERLVSRFQVSHGMLLNVLSRKGDGCRAMRELIRDCHDYEGLKDAHRKRAWQLFRALVERDIVEFSHDPGGRQAAGERGAPGRLLHEPGPVPLPAGDPAPAGPGGPRLRARPDHPCGGHPGEPRDHPAQAAGPGEAEEAGRDEAWPASSTEERMLELEKLEYPKPQREFIYGTFNAFAARHPWVGEENIRPKSIAREMFERYCSFCRLRAGTTTSSAPRGCCCGT